MLYSLNNDAHERSNVNFNPPGRLGKNKFKIINKGNIVVVVEREKKSLLCMKKASTYRLALMLTDADPVMR